MRPSSWQLTVTTGGGKKSRFARVEKIPLQQTTVPNIPDGRQRNHSRPGGIEIAPPTHCQEPARPTYLLPVSTALEIGHRDWLLRNQSRAKNDRESPTDDPCGRKNRLLVDKLVIALQDDALG